MVEDAEISGLVPGRRSEASDLSLQRGSSHPNILSWEEQIFSTLTTMTDWEKWIAKCVSFFKTSKLFRMGWKKVKKQVLRVIIEVSSGLDLL